MEYAVCIFILGCMMTALVAKGLYMAHNLAQAERNQTIEVEQTEMGRD